MKLTGAEHDELMADVEEFRQLSSSHETFSRRLELHHKWIVSKKLTPKEWLELVQPQEPDTDG